MTDFLKLTSLHRPVNSKKKASGCVISSSESQPEPEWPVERKMMNGVGGGGIDEDRVDGRARRLSRTSRPRACWTCTACNDMLEKRHAGSRGGGSDCFARRDGRKKTHPIR